MNEEETLSGERPRPDVRRVVTGFDAAGRSAIVADEPVATSVERPGGTVIVDLWQVQNLPAYLHDGDGLGGAAGLAPPPAGAVVRMCVFPPDSEMDMDAFEASMRAVYGAEASSENTVPGMHRTETVDVLMVLSGELHVVMEAGETLLRRGDTLVQRGTRHAWSNRTDEPTTVISIMMGAQG